MKRKSLLCVALLGVVFSACEHSVSTETIVGPDGSLDKKIVLEINDTTAETNYMLSADKVGSWNRQEVDSLSGVKKAKAENKLVVWSKHFASAEEANAELATPNDSLFRMESKFEKKFRWFYTYIEYSDTYYPVNRLELESTDYFTPEDYAFIDRLPAEGSTIGAADSLYLHLLNEKIYDHYGTAAYFEEYYNILLELVKQTPATVNWTDTLLRIKPDVFKKMETSQDLPDDFIIDLADSLGIPLVNAKESPLYKSMKAAFESKVNFISWASDGNYQHAIEMPWPVVATNADSVSGNKLYWRPSPIKFTLGTYTMYAHSRKMNYWAVVLSLLVVASTIYLLFRARRKQ